MAVIPFPAAPEPEPEPLSIPAGASLIWDVPNPFATFDALVRSAIEVCGEKTAREALNDLLSKPAREVLGWLLFDAEGDQP